MRLELPPAARKPHRIRLQNVFLRRTDWTGADLTEANFAGSDFKNANFTDADFARANLDGTILVGAELTGARNLTVDQLSRAVLDETTRLPDYIDRSAVAAARHREPAE